MPLLVPTRALGYFFFSCSVKYATASRSQVLGDILPVGAEAARLVIESR